MIFLFTGFVRIQLFRWDNSERFILIRRVVINANDSYGIIINRYNFYYIPYDTQIKFSLRCWVMAIRRWGVKFKLQYQWGNELRKRTESRQSQLHPYFSFLFSSKHTWRRLWLSLLSPRLFDLSSTTASDVVRDLIFFQNTLDWMIEGNNANNIRIWWICWKCW